MICHTNSMMRVAVCATMACVIAVVAGEARQERADDPKTYSQATRIALHDEIVAACKGPLASALSMIDGAEFFGTPPVSFVDVPKDELVKTIPRLQSVTATVSVFPKGGAPPRRLSEYGDATVSAFQRYVQCTIDTRLAQFGRPLPSRGTPAPPPARPSPSAAPPAPVAAPSGASPPATPRAAATFDSKTAPNSPDRRQLCQGYARARSLSGKSFDDWVDDCADMPALTVKDIKVKAPEVRFLNGGVCVTVQAVRTVPFQGDLRTTVELRNGCKGPQLVYADLKVARDQIYMHPIWIGATLPRAKMWPPNNAMPKLNYVPTFERDSATVLAAGAKWQVEVQQDLTYANDIDVKIAACDYLTPSNQPRTAFRSPTFNNFDCFDIPEAEMSANEKEMQRLLKDPRPVNGAKPALKTPPAATTKPPVKKP